MTPTTITWPAVAAAWGILLAGATGVMKTTDLVRSWATEHLSFTLPSYVWIIVPFGVGITTCLTSHLNPLMALFPTLPVHYGQVLSGIALGAIASPLHHTTALIASKVPQTDAPVAEAEVPFDPSQELQDAPAAQ